MNIQTLPDWRKGQTIFNFLEWLKIKGFSDNQNNRMADPFHIHDKEWDELFDQFIKEFNPVASKKKKR